MMHQLRSRGKKKRGRRKRREEGEEKESGGVSGGEDSVWECDGGSGDGRKAQSYARLPDWDKGGGRTRSPRLVLRTFPAATHLSAPQPVDRNEVKGLSRAVKSTAPRTPNSLASLRSSSKSLLGETQERHNITSSLYKGGRRRQHISAFSV